MHFHANSDRPSTAAAATGSRRRTNSFPRWSTITRRAISSGHFRSWNGTWPAHLVTESAAFFARLFQDCPEEVLARHPKAAFKHALAALSASDFPAFADRCRWLARYCAALDEAHPATPVLRGELEMLLALAEYNDIAAMSVRHRRAWELLGAPRGCIRRNPPGAWAVPPCCSCSTGKAANSGRKSG